MESLFSKESWGTNNTGKEVTPSWFLLVRATVVVAWSGVYSTLKITPAALGISTPRVSKAEAEAMVSSSLKSKALSLKGEISLPNLPHISAARSNYVLALLSSDWEVSCPRSHVSAEIPVTAWEARKVKLSSQHTSTSACIRLHSATNTNDYSVMKKMMIKGWNQCFPKQLLILGKDCES